MNDANIFLKEWRDQNEKMDFLPLSKKDRLEEVRRVEEGTYINPISTGIAQLDEHFNYFLGMLFMVTGYPQSGKSEILKYLATTWVKRGLGKVAFFSPESETPILIHEIEQILGTDPQDFFKFLEINENTGMPEIHKLIEEFDRLAKEGFNYFIIDPLNWLTSTHYGGTTFESLRLTLTYLKQFAKRSKSVVSYVEHPKTPQPNRDGDYPKASVFMVNGGVMHNNKCDGVILMHREKNVTEYGTVEMSKNDTVLFEIAKLKMQKYLGSPSTIQLFYDYKTGIYS